MFFSRFRIMFYFAIKCLYTRMDVHLMNVIPNSAIMFLTYEIVNSWLSQVTVGEDPATTVK